MTKPPKWKQSRPLTEQEKRDRAVLSVMKDYPLERGQMLFLGPESVRLLSTPGAFAGSLPDKLIIEKSEWNSTQRGGNRASRC